MAEAILEIAKVATYGAGKYTEDGWKDVQDGIKRYRAAGDRHRLYRRKHPYDHGENGSGLLHLAHEAWNRIAELQLLLESMEPKCGGPVGPMPSNSTFPESKV